jgi:hypothetical protein
MTLQGLKKKKNSKASLYLSEDENFYEENLNDFEEISLEIDNFHSMLGSWSKRLDESE